MNIEFRLFNWAIYYSMLDDGRPIVKKHCGSAEHNFKGYLLGKIPLLRSLNFNTVIGVNSLWTTGNKPYSEYSIGISNIGFGKYRILRVDYVKAYQGGWQDSGVMFGSSIGM